MANLRQKNVQQRSSRRNRYVHAIEPFRKKYNCTAAQVFDIIQGIESENKTLRQETTNQARQLEEVKEKLKEKEARVLELETIIAKQ